MAIGPIARQVSRLGKVVEELPDNWVMKTDSVPNYLQRQQVPPEELRWAGLELPEGVTTKADLTQGEAQRLDRFSHDRSNVDQQYNYVASPEARASGNQFTHFMTFKETNGPGSRYTDPHFSKPNYLYHARGYDIDGTNQPTPSVNTTAINEDLRLLEDGIHLADTESAYDGLQALDHVGAERILSMFEDSPPSVQNWSATLTGRVQRLRTAVSDIDNALDYSVSGEIPISLVEQHWADIHVDNTLMYRLGYPANVAEAHRALNQLEEPSEVIAAYAIRTTRELYEAATEKQRLRGTSMTAGQNTRVIEEIQSDLHQQGRLSGYYENKPLPPPVQQLYDSLQTSDINLLQDLVNSEAAMSQLTPELLNPIFKDEIVRTLNNQRQLTQPLRDAQGMGHEEFLRVLETERAGEYIAATQGVTRQILVDSYVRGSQSEADILQRVDNHMMTSLRNRLDLDMRPNKDGLSPVSPWEKTWTRRSLETEVVAAANDGKTQVAILLDHHIPGTLYRGGGVDTWYQTTVEGTARKLAKSIGAEYEIVGPALQRRQLMLQQRPIQAAISEMAEHDRVLNYMNVVDATSTDPGMRAVRESVQTDINNSLVTLGEAPIDFSTATKADVVHRTESVRNDIIREVNNQRRAEIRAIQEQIDELPKMPTHAVIRFAKDPDADKTLAARKAVLTADLEDAQLALQTWRAEQGGSPNPLASEYEESQNNLIASIAEELHSITTAPRSGVKPFTTPLYSAPIATLGAGVIAMDQLTEQQAAQVEQARAAGFADEQIAEGMQLNTITPDREELRRQGFSEEQIIAAQNRFRLLNVMPEDLASPSSEVQWVEDEGQRRPPKPMHVSDAQWEAEWRPRDSTMASVPYEQAILIASDLGVDPRTEQGINAVYNQYHRQTVGPIAFPLAAMQNRVATLEHLNEVYRPFAWFEAQFGVAAAHEYQKMQQDTVTTVLEMARERGIEMIYHEGRYVTTNPETGEYVDVTPDFLQSIGKAKYEVIGAVTGGLLPLAAAGTVTGPIGWLGLGLASIGLAATGAVVGNQIDYLSASITESETWDARMATERAIGAAQMSVIGDVAFLGLAKIGAFGWRGIRHGYNLARDGNSAGAFRALKESAGGLTDDQVREIILRWERLNETQAPGRNLAQQALHVLPESGLADRAAAAAVSYSSEAGNRVSAQVHRRAAQLHTAIQADMTPQLGRRLISELDAYESNVKSLFDVVKRQGQELAPPGYTFDAQALSIKPLVEHQINTISDPAIVERFRYVLSAVDNYTQGRTFSDLLEYRQLVNSLKYNRHIHSATDQRAIQTVLDNINTEIDTIARSTPEGTAWSVDWRIANRQYTEYKNLQDNVMYKAIRRGESVGETQIAKQLIKYGQSMDNTYDQVMSKLTPSTRRGVEMSIVDQVADKYTKGARDGMRAVDFVELSRSLRNYSLKTEEASAMRQIVDEFAEVYKNDPRLGAETGHIQIPTFTSYLTTDPTVRAQYALASSVFNRARALVPGNASDSIALVQQTAKFLERPMNQKTTNDLLGFFKDQPQYVELVRNIQRSVAAGREPGRPGIEVYRDSSGRNYLQPGAGRSAINETVSPHRIVSDEIARNILGVPGITASTLTKANKLKLMDQGYVGVVLDDGQMIPLYVGARK